jgi:hypothetical protein
MTNRVLVADLLKAPTPEDLRNLADPGRLRLRLRRRRLGVGGAEDCLAWAPPSTYRGLTMTRAGGFFEARGALAHG